MGYQYAKLTDEEKKHLAEKLKLGDDYEQKLSTIMSSDAARTGARRKDQETYLKDTLKMYKKYGYDTSQLGDNLLKTYEETYGIDHATVANMLSGGGDIDKIVTAALEAKYESEEAKAKPVKPKPESEEEGGKAGITSAAARRIVKSNSEIVRHQAILNGKVDGLQTSLNSLVRIIGEKQPKTVIELNGNEIVEYVANNPIPVGGERRIETAPKSKPQSQ